MTPEEVRGILGSALPPVRPEVELLLASARARITPERAEQIARLAGSDLDWPLVVRLARLHGVAPLLYRSLHATCADRVPVEVLRGLAYHYHRNSLHNQWLIQHLIGLLDALSASGIPAIPLKGPVLGAAVYGDPALRESCDLDVLVHEPDLPSVEEILRGLGYASPWPWPVDSPGGRFTRGYSKGISFAGGSRRPHLDVHWRLSHRCLPMPPDLSTAWAGARSVRLGERDLPCLDPQELLLFAWMRGGSDAWQYLSLVCDLAQCLAAHPEPEWAAVVEGCRAQGCVRLLQVGALVLAATLGGPVNEGLLRSALNDRPTVAYASRVVGALLAREGALDGGEIPRFRLVARERWADRLGYALTLALVPGPHEWAMIRLPGRLYWVYALLRPLRLAARHAGFAARYLLSR